MAQPLPHEADLIKAKVALMTMPGTVFLSTVMMSLQIVWDPNHKTAWVTGKKMGINPDFFMSLPKPQQLFVIVHETMHVVLMHMGRLQGRLPKKWNRACDHFINLYLKKEGYQMPSWVLADTKYIGMSADEIYKVLPDEGDNPMDDIRPGEGTEAEILEQISEVLVRAHVQAKQANEKPGRMPSEVDAFLNSLLVPSLPWWRILARYMKAVGKSDYSFRKPNRRHFPEHYLPSLYGGTLVDIAVAVDISGSVSDDEFSRFVKETELVFKICRPQNVSVIQFDTEIKSVTKVRSISELRNVNFQGRGGTYIPPVMEWANKHKPKLLLVFTDGGFHFPDDFQCNCPLIWLIHNNAGWTAPKGQVIHYEIK